MPIEDDQGLRRILEYDRVAVVGASTTYEKAAHIVPAYLQRHGYTIRPVNPTATRVLEQRAYDSLADVSQPVDIVEIFRPSAEVSGIVEQAKAREDIQAVWMQPGIRHESAAKSAEAAGIDVVQDRCMKSEHGRLIRHPMG